ncbi:MAG: Crp/Fnr family transcriptional regulator [Bdellovibrionales bacterium]|nr:Crp/Fnr family transcriptional regulator [Bdellovibrionales bacterium]
MTPQEIAQILSHSQLFHGLSSETLSGLAGTGEILSLKAGDYLLESGQPVPGLLIPLSGSFQVSKKGQILADRIGRGSFFGEISLFVVTMGATASVQATHPSSALLLKPKSLQAWFGKNADVEKLFYKNLSAELARRLYSTTTAATES